MFTVEQRDRVRDRVLELAGSDARVVGAAEIGSFARGDGDAYSDLDLTFALAEDAPLADVLGDWTRRLADEFGAVPLLDLSRGPITYRVLLLPEWLQVDLSFSPVRMRRAAPAFRLLFGEAEEVAAAPPSAQEFFGWGVIYARHAAVCAARGHPWQAEYCISAVRDHALALACLARGLPTSFGRGFDRLPEAVLAGAKGALVRSLEPAELRRARGEAVAALLRESGPAASLAGAVEPQLLALADLA